MFPWFFSRCIKFSYGNTLSTKWSVVKTTVKSEFTPYVQWYPLFSFSQQCFVSVTIINQCIRHEQVIKIPIRCHHSRLIQIAGPPYMGQTLNILLVPGWCHGQSPSSVACWNLSAHATPKEVVRAIHHAFVLLLVNAPKGGQRWAMSRWAYLLTLSAGQNINLMSAIYWSPHVRLVLCPTFKQENYYPNCSL